jgi:hypothetical protein
MAIRAWLLLPVLLTACVQEATVPSMGDRVVELRVLPSAATLGPEEILTITASLTNTLDQTVVLGFNTTCQVLIYVRNDAGRIVTPEGGSHSCPGVSTQMTIPALATITREFLWTGRGEFGTGATGPRLPAGRYFVSATLNATNYSTVGFAVLVTLTD